MCHSEVTFVDIHTENVTVLDESDLTIEGTNITFTTQQLRENHCYNVTVTAFNIAGPGTPHNFEISIIFREIVVLIIMICLL